MSAHGVEDVLARAADQHGGPGNNILLQD